MAGELILSGARPALEAEQIRPRADWAVVLRDRRKTTLSWGLIVPMETNHEKLHEGSGVIVRVGIGPIAKAESIAVGTRILFRGYLKDIHKLPSTLTWDDGEAKEFSLISLVDVAAVLEHGVEVGLLSERR